MSIFIVNSTTADNVGYIISGTGSGTAVLTSGQLGANVQNNRVIFEPPVSPVYPSFLVKFTPISSSGSTSVTVPDQSEVRLAMEAEISSQTSGIKIVNEIDASLSYAVFGQTINGSGRTPIQSGSIASSGVVPISGSAFSTHNFFDVELSQIGTGTAKATIQDKSSITFAVFTSDI